MKKTVLIAILSLITIPSVNAQQLKGISGENNWLKNWTNFKPATTEYNDASNILTGIIDCNIILYKKNTYRLVGTVYVTKNAVLTIEPGTVIRGDKETCGTLVVTKGASIIAEGTETDPIVFTSNNNISERKPGDWGGIIILGDAPINKMGGVSYLDFNLDSAISYYGGQDQDSNSGILKYVRIEFSGRKINALKELNGISLAGVGRKTKIDYIQVSYSNDDSFECYGGLVNLNNLISYRATDDDFDYTQGVQCNISNSLAIRHPFSSDISGSRCFEIDSYDKPENTDFSKKLSKITANNITLINMEESNQGLVREAIYVKDKSYFSLNNSVVSGFKQCVLLENKIAVVPANLAKINLQGILINNCESNIQSEIEANNTEIMNWYKNDSFSLEYSKVPNASLFAESNTKKIPDFRLKANNVVVNGY
ncbi:hypothetical protein ACFX5E_13495 [Flavobacterium sp. LS2P90]|uniref:Uncharacterized protein n=1 Tax=Flavobacterium xylosi TaxID=3230415 RepID=A0ABW6HYI0_9FLAO